MKKSFLPIGMALVAIQVFSQQSQAIDPGKILFSVPTLSDEIAEVEALPGQPPKDALVFHEDDWRQVEFVQASQLPELKRILTEYKAFEAQNRTGAGWKNVYVRKLKSRLVIQDKNGSGRVAQLVKGKVRNSLVLASSGGYGNVKRGFAIDLGGNISLYGTSEDSGISTLAASMGSHPDDSRLTKAFSVLQKDLNLVLVDWRAQVVLLSTAPSGKIEVWRP